MPFFRKRGEKPADEPRIEELTAGERDWLASLLGAVGELGLEGDIAGISAFFDGQRAEWFAGDPDTRSDPNMIINIAGAGLGQVLVDRAGMRWAVVTDAYGTEMGVVAEPGHIVVLPMNAVGKRWVESGAGGLDQFTAQTIEQVRAIRAAAR